VILVDSDVLIAHLRGIAAARDWLVAARRRTGPLATSVVSVAEVTGRMRAREQREVTRLLDALQTIPVNRAIAWRAGELRRAYHRSHNAIGIADYLIAATALVNGCELATLNVRHFPMIEDLAAPFPVT
jgi:predicted nucleic acid-binding protein